MKEAGKRKKKKRDFILSTWLQEETREEQRKINKQIDAKDKHEKID